ncbi:MAG: hypothetical protein HY340_01240 [Candidatus Kerfeldbacteria bacterium]|nr:hypothetical protein [Candidatus Kerfeldbacteria bacterium]
MPPQRASRSPLLLLFVVVVVVFGISALALWWPDPTTLNKPATNGSTLNGNANAATATTTANANASPAAPEPTITYDDEEFGFTLKYPESWQVKKEENGEAENRIVNYSFGTGEQGVTLVVVPSALEGIIRESVAIESETTRTINGRSATVARARSAKDGSAVTLIFFSKDDTVFVLNGAPETVDRIGSTFSF